VIHTNGNKQCSLVNIEYKITMKIIFVHDKCILDEVHVPEIMHTGFYIIT
jgi:hypothetical protein